MRSVIVAGVMGWTTDAIEALRRGEEVTVCPRGGSMRGRIEDGQPVTLAPVSPADVEVDEVVLVRWKSGVLLHLVKEAEDDQLLIGNNVGKINGWVPRSHVLGRVVAIHPRAPEDGEQGDGLRAAHFPPGEGRRRRI